MKNINPIIALSISIFFAFLFCYASVSKVLEFEEFQLQLAQSPLLSAYAGITSYAIICIEVSAVFLLCIPKTRLLGLYISLGLMVGFTVYIFLILNYSEFIPCSCGGILEKLGWPEHLIFNSGCIGLSLIGIYFHEKNKNSTFLRPAMISAAITISICLLVILLFLSSEYIMKKENNFTGRFLLHPLLEEQSIDLGINSYYFAGIAGGKIYLGNITAPLLMTVMDTSLQERKTIRMHLDQSNYPFKNLQLLVKEPFFYCYDGSVPIIYRGLLKDSIAHTISYNDAYFTQIAATDSSTFIIRTQSRENKQYLLASLNLTKTPKLRMHPSILEKQLDGVFDVDGKLIIPSNSTEIIYSYAYRNQYIVLDADLTVKKKLRTIDTTTIAKILTRRLSDGTHKMSAPPLKVNGTATANRNWIFIQSNLRGKFESVTTWSKSSTVDIYRTDAQDYIGSFSINKEGENPLSQMLSDDGFLYVLIGNKLKRYRFREPTKYFKAGNAENLTQSRP